MALKKRNAGSCEYIIYSGNAIGTSSSQLVSCAVEASVKHFIVVTAESFDTLAAANVPEFAGAVNTASKAIVTSEIKLTARELPGMALEGENALTCAYIPDLGSIIE